MSDSGGQEPEKVVLTEEFYNQEDELQKYLEHIYQGLKAKDYYGINFLLLSSVPSDVVEVLPANSPNEPASLQQYQKIDRFTVKNLSVVESFWDHATSIRTFPYALIKSVPDLDVPQELKDQALGQAHFFRALVYFDLNRVFGGIPGVVGKWGALMPIHENHASTDNCNEQYEECEESSPPPLRPSLSDSYAYIESDLQVAADLLPSSFSGPDAPSQAAAKALLARLYLYSQKWEKAETLTTQVIENYSLHLSDTYSDVFKQGNHSGNIFALSLDEQDLWNWYLPAEKGGYQNLAIHKSFAELIQSRTADARNQLVNAYINEGGEIYYCTKFKPYGGQIQLPLLRLAEMYLIRSEARTRLGDILGAVSDLNVIRNRAGLTDTTGTGVDTAEKVLKAIAFERSIEFMSEGHRWFDLVRTGRAMGTLENIPLYSGEFATLDATYKQLFPIPRNIGEWQNPGY